MAAAWQAYRWNSARPNDSSIRLGSSAHTCTHPDAMAGSSARISDQITEPFPDPVAPAISTCVAASRSRHGEPSSHRPTGSPARSTSPGDRQGADRVGQGVGADQLQHHHPGCGGADPAQPGAERVRQVLRPGLEVRRGLPGHQPGPHQVHRPGPVHPVQHREHRLAPVVRGEPGQGHGGLPPAPVEPPPQPVPHRPRHEPGEPHRLQDPQPGQPDDGNRGQADDAGPSQCRARSPRPARPPRRPRDGSGRTRAPARSGGRAGRP